MKKGVNRFSNLKDLQNVIRDKWHDVDVRQPESEKPYSSEKTSSSSNKEEWRTYSAHFLLISWLTIRPTLTFWRSMRTSGNAIACKNCFMACDAILFVSRLIQKCFRRKFLHIFEDVWSLHICFWTDSFRLLGWIMHANVRDVFLRHPVIRIVWFILRDVFTEFSAHYP